MKSLLQKQLLGSLFVSVVALMATGSPAMGAVVDDFESYDLGTLLPGTGGWTDRFGLNANASSPTVEDDTTTVHTEFSGQFMQIVDDNSAANHSEAIGKATPVTLSNDGDYIQFALNYISGSSGTFTMRLRGGGSTFGDIGINKVGGTALRWNYEGINAPSTANDPVLGTWYVLRATLRDNAGGDGVVDAFDFEAFDVNMNSLFSITGLTTGGIATVDDIIVIGNGSSSTGVGLVDSIEAVVPEPASLGLLGLGGLMMLRLRR